MNAKKIFQFSVGPIGSAVIGLVSIPIVAWFFPPEDIGRLTMLQVALSFSLMLFTLGLDQAYVREFHEVEDKPGLLKAVMLPGFLGLSSVLVILLILPWSASQLLFGFESIFLTTLLFISVFLTYFSRFLSLILRMQERGLAFSMSQLLPKIFFLLILVIYIVIGADANFANLMLANFISLGSVFVVFAWNTRKQWQPALIANIDKTKQKQMIRYAIPLIGSGVAFWGLTAMDKMFLRNFSTFEELGIYSVSVSFAGAALVFQAIFSTVWAPTVYKWAAEGVNPIKIKNVIDYVTIAVMVIWSIAGMFSWVVSYILPPEYEAVPYILLAAMAYPLLYTLSEATGVGIGIKRKTIYSLFAAIIALAVNAFGNWWFIPAYGAAGAAMASALAFFVFFVIRTEASARLWYRFERLKMYVLLILLTGFSLLINTNQFHLNFIVFVYVGFLVLIFFSFLNETMLLLRFLYNQKNSQ